MILRACSVCGALSAEKRCEAHRPTDDRPSASARGYGTRWQAIRGRYLRSHPTCEELFCSQPATDVDHVDGRGPSGNNSDANLRAYCHAHHSRKTALDDGGFGRRRASR